MLKQIEEDVVALSQHLLDPMNTGIDTLRRQAFRSGYMLFKDRINTVLVPKLAEKIYDLRKQVFVDADPYGERLAGTDIFEEEYTIGKIEGIEHVCYLLGLTKDLTVALNKYYDE